MRNIKLWHKTGSMPAFNETLAFLDDEEVPMDEVGRGDSIQKGVFLTNQELEAERRKAYEAGQGNVTFKERVLWALPYADYAASLEQKGEEMSRNEADGLINELMNKQDENIWQAFERVLKEHEKDEMKDEIKVIDGIKCKLHFTVGIGEEYYYLKKGDLVFRPVKEEPMPTVEAGDYLKFEDCTAYVLEGLENFYSKETLLKHYRNGKLIWSRQND